MPESCGGIERIMHLLAAGMVKSGISVRVLALTDDKTYSVKNFYGYKLHKVPKNFEIGSNGFSYKAFQVFRDLAKQVDIINFHFPWPFMDILYLMARVKTPYVITYHSDIVRQRLLYIFYKPFEKLSLIQAKQIICSSPNYFLSSKILNAYHHKISIIPFGLDKLDYPKLSENKKSEWRDAIGRNFFLFIGYHRYYKGLYTLIESARLVPYLIVIAGSGPLEVKLKKMVKKYALKNVLFVGHITEEDKVALISLSKSLILPSNLRSEAFGVVLLEGLMFGKPLISTEIGTGTSFVNVSGETGIVIPPLNPGALANAMSFIFNNSAEVKKMGLAAKKRFDKVFHANKMVLAYKSLYRKIL